MDSREARYPFLDAAREAVRASETTLAGIAADASIRDRARERVESAIETGTVGAPHPNTRVELLSYPLARVLVSLIDENVLTRRYARAETETARQRIENDRETTALESTDRTALSTSELLAEFDLRDSVHERNDSAGREATYEVALGPYLQFLADERNDDRRLVESALSEGVVPVSAAELDSLLETRIEARVRSGLPLTAPAGIADTLAATTETVRERLADLGSLPEIDVVVPSMFPPCMRTLLDAIRAGEELPEPSQFALVAFLVAIGLETEELLELCAIDGFEAEITRYRVAHIGSAPPSCETMRCYGECDCPEDVSHPLEYYERALEGNDEYVDWRETHEFESNHTG